MMKNIDKIINKEFQNLKLLIALKHKLAFVFYT